MAEGCGARCAKILLICLNIIFILSGLALIAIGIWLIADQDVLKIVKFIVSDDYKLFRSAAILLITIGVFVLIVSVLGFVGVIKEHRVILTVYIVLLVIVFAGECAGGIIAIVYKDKIRNRLDEEMTKSLLLTLRPTSPYYISYNVTADEKRCKSSEDAALWDYVQVKFSCCGIHDGGGSGYEASSIDFNEICPMLKLPGNKPLTCCAPKDEDMEPIDTTDQSKHRPDFDCGTISKKGCADEMYEWIEKYAPALIGIGIGIAMFQLVVIIFVVCLCQHPSRGKDV